MDSQELPLGFAMGLAMNAGAMEHYGRMTEAEKEDVILKCRDAKTKDEMQRIINSLDNSQTQDIEFPSDIFEGPGIG